MPRLHPRNCVVNTQWSNPSLPEHATTAVRYLEVRRPLAAVILSGIVVVGLRVIVQGSAAPLVKVPVYQTGQAGWALN